MAVGALSTTLGSMLIGGFFSSFLGGIVAIEVAAYFRVYKTDSLGFKALVLTVFALDLFHTGCIWAAMWEYVITNWGTTSKLDFIPWSISLTVLVTALVTFLVHCFFAHRIFRLSKGNWYMAGPVVFFAFLRLVAATASTVEMFHYQSFRVFVARVRWVFTLGLSFSSSVDILITALFLYLFRGSRRPEGSHLNKVLDQLALYAFETGSLTCIGTVVSMICWVTMNRSNLVFLGLHFAIGKLYAISLLVTLNTRESVRRSRSTGSTADRGAVLILEARSNKNHRSSSPYFAAAMSQTKTEVQIAVERNVQYDLRTDQSHLQQPEPKRNTVS
ncbi:hypothetical protein MIND_00257000 [Mycena indigotica]|uniref:DUF6534 domain-containing protein n=1 Tax=Mycena indigotica TaxID=2126181 RepID=A0A8H6T7P5_9AGAR|nr:uncharacterized protein MIND_00257000 [Mycena indigotica]KAF7312435.1 hypothetical protein MIND_00257000 [Mycena indigotica]